MDERRTGEKLMKKAWFVLVLALIGCHPPRVGAFGLRSFDLTLDHYRIAYAQHGHVVSSEWLINNFRLERGRPTQVKWTSEYTRTLRPDMDSDGAYEPSFTIPRFDLSYTHAHDGADLWVQTTPVSTRIGMRDLDVIAHDFVDRVGGGSYFEIDWAADALRERRIGTVVREEGPVQVGGVPAYWVTFEIVSVDQRDVNQAHQGDLVTVVLMRPEARWNTERRYGRGLPMLVTAGYASRGEHHATHRAEFEDLLRRIEFHEAHTE